MAFISCITSIPCWSQVSNNHEAALSAYVHQIECSSEPDVQYNLGPVANLVKDKDIIAMGEASHGAHEFFEIKAQMFKQLVLQHGFRMFAIESTLGNTYSINRFLAYGLGDAKTALRELDNGYWNSQEILDLIIWMRAYNLQHEADEHLFFYGFDVNSRSGAAYAILKYIQLAMPSYFKLNEQKLRMSLFSNSSDGRAGREVLKKYLEAEEASCLKNTAPWEYALAMRSFVNLEQIDSMPALSINARDKYMADNVMWIRESVLPKMMLFAHNFHVANHKNKRYKTMGYHLEKRLTSQYAPIGFDFYSGEVIVKRGGHVLAVALYGNKNVLNTVKPPKRNSFSDQLARLPYPIFCLDIQRAIVEETSLRDWFHEPRLVHDLGAWCGRGHNQAPYNLSEAYDALIYVHQVSPSKHLVYPE